MSLFKFGIHHLSQSMGIFTLILFLHVTYGSSFPSGSTSPSLFNSSDDGTVIGTILSSSEAESDSCDKRNSSCDVCVKSKKCFYCYSTSSCLPLNLRLSGCSSIKETAYGTCFVKFNVLAIALGSMAGVIILALVITFCCCCRCKRKRSGWEVDNQKENLTMRGSVIRDNAFARREERQKRVDEIKRKYGIPDKKYNRF